MSSRSLRKHVRTLRLECLSQRRLLAADVRVPADLDADVGKENQPAIVSPVAGDAIEETPLVEESFGEKPRQNPANRYDVNNDNRISAHDALLVINQLHRQRRPTGKSFVYFHFTDIDGDGALTPVDSLQLINQIARQGPPSTIDTDDPDDMFDAKQVDEVHALGIDESIQ